MKYGLWLTLLLLVCLVSPVAAQDVTSTPTPRMQFTIQTDPASLIGAFYNAIALRDYPRAYAYWEQNGQPQTQDQFAAGFSDTSDAHVLVRLPIASDAGAGNIHASIPTLVIATHTDGTTHYYVGCFTAHKTNVPVGNATEPDPNWYIQTGTLNEQTALDLTALDTACETTYSLADDPYPQSQLDPVSLIQAYLTAIATGNAAQTPTYLESPDLFSQQYSNAIASAQSLGLIVNPEVFGQGAAGSIYASVPALVVFTLPDNTSHYVNACFVGRLSNVPVGNATTPDPNWHIYSMTLNEAPDATNTVSTLALGCNP